MRARIHGWPSTSLMWLGSNPPPPPPPPPPYSYFSGGQWVISQIHVAFESWYREFYSAPCISNDLAPTSGRISTVIVINMPRSRLHTYPSLQGSMEHLSYFYVESECLVCGSDLEEGNIYSRNSSCSRYRKSGTSSCDAHSVRKHMMKLWHGTTYITCRLRRIQWYPDVMLIIDGLCR